MPEQADHPHAAKRSVTELPVLDELASPHWGLDLTTLAEDVFARDYQGPMRTPDGGQTDGSLLLYRNADLKALAAHPDLGNQPPGSFSLPFHEDGQVGAPGFEHLMSNSLFTMLPPLHGAARQVVSRRLTVKSLGGFAPEIATLVDGVLTDALERGDVDFKADVTNRVMAGFWSLVLGWTPEEAVRACELATRVQASNCFRPTAEQKRDINAASLELLELLSATLARELRKEDRALLVGLVAEYAELQEAGRPDAVEALFGVSLLDGLHSLSGVMASVVHALLHSEPDLAAVRADRSLVTRAFHEGVRLHPAVILTSRHALRSFEFQGVEVPEDAAVTMLWMLGNRDPGAFDAPNAYRLDRPTRPQTTFGGGFYICPGRNVVKLLTEALLTAMTAPGIEAVPTGDVRWVTESGLHEPEAMPMRIRRTQATPTAGLAPARGRPGRGV